MAFPSDTRRRANFSCSGVSFRGRPKRTPLFLAASRPALVRSRIRPRSNSAIPAKMVMIIFPACVVVSAHGSDNDWNFPSTGNLREDGRKLLKTKRM